MISSTGMPGRFVAMDIAQTMNYLEPRAMAKLQQQAGGGTAIQMPSSGRACHPPPPATILRPTRQTGSSTSSVTYRRCPASSAWPTA